MNYYYPFVQVPSNPEIVATYPAKKQSTIDLDAKSDLDFSFFESDDAKIGPSDEELQMAATITPEKKTRKKSITSTPAPVASGTAPTQGNITALNGGSFLSSYDEVNAMYRQTIVQADVLASEVKTDLDKIRGSSTMKGKYTYIANLTGTEASLLSTKLQAIDKIQRSITDAHNLELKRAKDIKDAAKDQQNDDARMMDMYNAFINSPMGMYQNALNMPKVPEMMLGVNGMNPTVQGIAIAEQATTQGQLTPEQLRMRMETNPNIEEVVMYEPSSGRRWFEVIDNMSGMPVPNYPKSDDFLLADCTIDVRAGTARNRNIDRVWRLVNTEATILEY